MSLIYNGVTPSRIITNSTETYRVDCNGVPVFHRFPIPLSQGIASPDLDINISDMQMGGLSTNHMAVIVHLNPRWGGVYYYPDFGMLFFANVQNGQIAYAPGYSFTLQGGTERQDNYGVYYNGNYYAHRIVLTPNLGSFRLDFYLDLPIGVSWMPQWNNFYFALNDKV